MQQGPATIYWWGVLLALSLAGASIPLVTENLSLWFYLCLWIAMATGMNLIAGFTGYLPFGYVAFFGVGAYSVGIITQNFALPMPVGLLGAAVFGALVAVIFAPTLRLSGVFFSMTSFSLSLIMQVLLSNLPEALTGGGGGINFTRGRDPTLHYYLMLALALAAVAAATVVATSRFGLELKAIKDDPVAAAAAGINVPARRLAVWLMAAVIAALTGSLDALYTSIIDPETAFSLTITAKTIVYAALGGFGTVMGPVLGAMGMTVIDEFVWARFPNFNLFLLGLIIVFIVLVLPRGILGTLLARMPRLRRLLF